jgi:3-oxoacyl-[acyl-carrier protein] reductase
MVDLLHGKVAAVTGGSRGIGLAIVQAFVAEGARVVIGDIDPTAAKTACDALGGPSRCRAVACDVGRTDDMAALIQAAVESFGSIDVMVNNAGITRDSMMRSMSEEQFDSVIQVNLKGCWNGTRVAAAVMREQKAGSIVNISSLSGKVGIVGQTNYSAAKAGIVGLSKAAAKELAPHGVRVNVIQPGLIRTPMTEAMPQHVWDSKMAEIPLGRAGEPSEVASVAVFYASSLSSYMTGTVAEVAGGRLM